MVSYILDTDHLSLLQRGHEPLRQHLLDVSPDQIAITIISVEEMLRGRLTQIGRAKRAPDRVVAYYWFQETLDFITDFVIVPYSAEADTYFEAFSGQKIRIGTQDLRIASITFNANAVLVTRNWQDFEGVPNLRLDDWSRFSG